MSRCKNFLRSSIGKKFIVAITGLGLSGFVLTHMSGNLLLLVGAESYNRYAHALITNPLIEVAELGLVFLLLVHLGLALKLQLENRAARGVKPSQNPSACEKRARFASKSMALTGLLILVFVIFHLKTFKYGPHYEVTYDGVVMRDLYRLVLEEFKETGEVVFYLFSMGVLFMHLSHGFSGALQSLGITSSRNRTAYFLGLGFAVIVAGGFIIQPIYLYLWGGQ